LVGLLEAVLNGLLNKNIFNLGKRNYFFFCNIMFALNIWNMSKVDNT